MRVLLCFFCILLVGCTQPIETFENLSMSTIRVTVFDLNQESKEYTLDLYSTMQDLLKLIECDACDLSRLNPQSPLSHKDVIVLYPKVETCISLNQASVDQLDDLPGIGPALAQRIIDYRSVHGFFQQLEDIMLVKGIKTALFSKMHAILCL